VIITYVGLVFKTEDMFSSRINDERSYSWYRNLFCTVPSCTEQDARASFVKNKTLGHVLVLTKSIVCSHWTTVYKHRLTQSVRVYVT